MFFAEDRDIKSCVNKQKSDMQNFYGNNNAAAESRKAPVTNVGNSCGGELKRLMSDSTAHSDEIPRYVGSENFIIDVSRENGKAGELFEKASGFVKKKISKSENGNDNAKEDKINLKKTKSTRNLSFEGFKACEKNIVSSEGFSMFKTVLSYIMAFLIGLGCIIFEIIRMPFKKRARVKVIAGGTTLVLLAAICITANAAGYKLGYEVSINGESIGTVVSQDDAFAAVDSAKETINQYGGEEYEAEPVFSRTIVAPNSETSTEDLETTILSNVDSMVECATIFVNGEAVIGLESFEDAELVLETYKEKYMPENFADDSIIEFCETVEIEDSFISYDMIKDDVDEAVAALSENQEDTQYVVDSDDTLWDIAVENGTTVEKILALNEGLTEVIHSGDVIEIKAAKPLISVRTVETKEYTESVAYETETVYSDSLYVGKSEITTKGVNGEASVIAKVTSINGVEEEREIIDRTVTTEPVTQVKTIGTKELPKTAATGTFGRPTTSGTLSSKFGTRWGRNHNGIDIAVPTGTAVYAADGGVVTYSGWMSGYGNYITIDHQNGYQTSYGHNSKVLVSVGQKVAKGDKIALSGNTGNSTGPHLHFEVKKNGVFQNPLNYVNY